MMDNVQSEKEEKLNTSAEETSSVPVEGTTEEIASTPVENLTSEEETTPLSIEDTESKDETISVPVRDSGILNDFSSDEEEFSHGEMETAAHGTKQKKKGKKKQEITRIEEKSDKSKEETSSAPEEDDDSEEEFSHGEMETAMHATEQNKKDKKNQEIKRIKEEKDKVKKTSGIFGLDSSTEETDEETGIVGSAEEEEERVVVEEEEEIEPELEQQSSEHVYDTSSDEESGEEEVKLKSKDETLSQEIPSEMTATVKKKDEVMVEVAKPQESKETIPETSEIEEKIAVIAEKVSFGKKKSNDLDSDIRLRDSEKYSADEISDRKEMKLQRNIQQRRESVEGIYLICITPETQNIINCVIGQHVTTEKPWFQIKRERIEYIIETEEQVLDFDSIKEEIKKLKLEDMWIGYDSANEIPNNYFVCVTESANLYMTQQLEMLETERKRRIEEILLRPGHEWTSLGSEKDVVHMNIVDSRPLYQTEHEIIIESLLVDPKFTDLNTEDSIHGYRHILPREGNIPQQIPRFRNEVYVQACKELTSSCIQTDLIYLHNNWTQCEQSVFVTEVTETEILEDMEAFLKTEYPFLDKTMNYNISFNLYEDDYPILIIKEADIQPLQQNYQKLYKEYLSFTDVLHCKNKYISAIAWHPLWTGIIACTYVDYIRYMNVRIDEKETNEILRAVHGSNPVLIWSFVDSLKPKLILECSREVHALNFCPFNENILIGGCINGQIVVWDLTDKLKKVEEIINLTPSQQMYREILFSLMSWMKNTRRSEYVIPAAKSCLQYSHTQCITNIQWLSPYYEISRIGKYGELRASEVTSLQFLSSSEDGAVCIWDLQAPIPKQAGLAKLQRKKKRVLPAALVAEVSRFKHLNNVLMPIFRINIIDPENDTIIPISALSSHKVKVNYELKNPKDGGRKYTLSERLLYSPILQEPGSYSEPEFYVGTMEGHIIRVTWSGYDTNTGEVINSELGKYPSWGQIHESPITHISRSQFFSNIILTSSAKVFAIWRSDINNVPLFWRRSKIGITSCSWSENYPNLFSILHTDGCFEVWNLLARSNSPVMFQSMSGKVLTGCSSSKIGPVQNVLGIADHRGALRVFMAPLPEGPIDVSYEIAAMVKLLNREKEKMELFQEWQNEWLDRNKEKLQAEQDIIQRELEKQEKESQKKEKLEEEKREKEALVKRLQKKQAQTVDIMKQNQEHWEDIQRRGYIKTIMKQRKLDKNEMLVKAEPLNKMKAQEKKKKSKQAEKIQQQDKIFEDTKKLLFPETLMQLKRRDLNIEIFRGEIETLSTSFTEDYKKIGSISLKIIVNNPYKYEFGWKEVLLESKNNQMVVEECINVRSEREDRYLKSKNERKLLHLNVMERKEQRSEEVMSSVVQFGSVPESVLNIPSTFLNSTVSLFSSRSISQKPLNSKSNSVHLTRE